MGEKENIDEGKENKETFEVNENGETPEVKDNEETPEVKENEETPEVKESKEANVPTESLQEAMDDMLDKLETEDIDEDEDVQVLLEHAETGNTLTISVPAYSTM